MNDGQAVPLQPTLWRTCRVLANRRRLRIVGLLFRMGELSVSAVAEQIGVSGMTASQYLRALGARGLLSARRDGRWVFYRPAADPSVHGSAELLTALRSAFATEREPVARVFRHVTAFTHLRRTLIVRAIRRGACSEEILRRRTGISRFALRRHLRKLERRGYVRRCGRHWLPRRPRGALAAALLRIACASLGDA